MSEPLSLRGYARRRNWSPSYVHKLIHEQGLPRQPDGRIDPVEADAFIARNLIGQLNDGVAEEHARQRRRRAAAAAPPSNGATTPAKRAHVRDSDRGIGAVVARYRHRILAAVDQEIDGLVVELTKGTPHG